MFNAYSVARFKTLLLYIGHRDSMDLNKIQTYPIFSFFIHSKARLSFNGDIAE